MFDLAGGRCTSSLSSVDLYRWNNKPKHIYTRVFDPKYGAGRCVFYLGRVEYTAVFSSETAGDKCAVEHFDHADHAGSLTQINTPTGGISLSTRTYYVPR